MSRYFTKDHEWIEVANGVGTVGITDFAQSQLGDITFVEAPETGAALKKGDCALAVDSVKAAADVYAPVAGEVTEANAALVDQPELVNTDPEVGGWLFRMAIADDGDLAGLMDRAAYDAYVAEL